MTAAAAFALLEADERFAGYSSTARALCAIAWANGAPLRPITAPADLEVLVVAELLAHRGYGAAEALARARGTIRDAHLRGAVRYASSRHARDQLGPALLERGVRSVRELSRSSAAELASWLFSLPADEPDEQATIAAALELRRAEPAPEELVLEEPAPEEPPYEGTVIGGCLNCGGPVAMFAANIAVYYRVSGRRPRYEWKSFSPLVEFGANESDAVWKRRHKRPPEIIKQALGGAHLLCRSCTGRQRLGLIEWPEVPEEELDVPGGREL